MINYCIFTDGSCRANGNGGLGIVWLKNQYFTIPKLIIPKIVNRVITNIQKLTQCILSGGINI